MDEHNEQYIADTILNIFESLDIPIKNCRGQSYDNTANMSGKYSGVQARIKEECQFAVFVPCAAHSLNLVGVQAVECVQEVVAYFLFVQNLFTFFSASTRQWNIMINHLGTRKVVKCLSDTRWSARANAINASNEGYLNISEALTSIADDLYQTAETRNEAQSSQKNG